MTGPQLPPRLEAALATWRHWDPEPGSTPLVKRRLEGGLSNQSWLVATDRGPVVVRLNARRDRRFNIDRRREQAILRALAGEPFVPPVRYCDYREGLLVTAFVAGDTLTEAAYRDPAVRRQVAAILDQLRKIPLSLPRFDYWAHLCHYREQILAGGISIPVALENLYRQNVDSLRRFAAGDWAATLVHHDLTPANLIATESGLVVIDWEYAAAGYRAMDRLPWLGEAMSFAREVETYSRLINAYWALLASME